MEKSRFFKIIKWVSCSTILALFYTHQEVEIVKTGFRVDRKRHMVSFLLDQHNSLVYNISRLESPKRIEDTLSANEIELCMRKAEDIQHVGKVAHVYRGEKRKKPTKESFLANIFDRFSTKAEAKVVK